MDASIILGGQTPDIIGAIDRGRAAAESQINLDRQNALAALYRSQGQQIMAGDPNALGRLAQFDPMTAQSMAFTVEDQQRKRDEGRRAAEAALKANADKLTAEQLAAEQKTITKGLTGATFFYQNKDKAGYENFLRQNGLDPAQYPFEQFPAYAATMEGGLDALKAFAPPAGPEWIAATPEQAAQYGATAGQINTKTGEFKKSGDGAGITQTITNPDGSSTTIQVGGSGKGADSLDLTESQGKATGFLYRMQSSNDVLNSLEEEGTKLWNKTAGGVPVVGNYMLSENAQKFEQAKRDFVNAVLRRESGAVISPDEFANAEKQYFPQPGDGPEVIAQKRENRRIAIEGVRASSGAGGSTDPGAGSGSLVETPAAPPPATGTMSYEEAWSKY